MQHEFDSKLAQIQSTLREREAELNSIRHAVLSVVTSAQGPIDKRKQAAVDEIWEGLLSARKLLWGVYIVSTLKISALSKQLYDPKVQAFIKGITQPLDSSALTGPANWSAQKARPWVSAMAWALYSAYVVVIGYAYTILTALRNGIADAQNLVARDKMVEMLRIALPELQIDWANLSDTTLPTLLDALELRLLKELQDSMSGSRADAEAVSRAKRIVELAADLQSAEEKARLPKW